jgi:hypothetical protein
MTTRGNMAIKINKKFEKRTDTTLIKNKKSG